MNRAGRGAAVVAAFCMAATGFSAVSGTQAATAAAPPGPAADARTKSAGSEAVATEYASAHRVTVTEAHRRLRAQEKSVAAAEKLDDKTGSTSLGMWIDRNSGKLHVNVRDDVAASAVRAAGGIPHTVGAEVAELHALKERLDAAASVEAPAGVRTWYVDTERRRLTVSAATGAAGLAKGPFAQLVRAAPDRVRVERAGGGQLGEAAGSVAGGQDIHNANGKRCSTGFNVRTANGAHATLTAGHCMQGNTSDFWFKNGALFGVNSGYANGSQDHALILNSLPSYWVPLAGVQGPGFVMAVTGRQNAVPGAFVCKSGRTTKLTCGVVEAVNVSASTAGGTKTGQVQTDMCVEPGDSGGAVVAGTRALGLVTAGIFHGQDNKCGEKVGEKNSSLYQPLGPALSAYGVSLLVTN
ncbi:S1 family peptidase [Streptomyces sp. NPDC005805]|uniref:S1 family peptidase n=1 Tax=Streptomyces sp. NPDC005805 TaxID=3157068 RepID=UPI00340B89D3